MITYQVISNNTKTSKHPAKFLSKQEIFTRVFNNTKHLKAGQYVKIKRTPNKGVVVEIIKDMERVNWQSNRPFFVLLKMDTGEEVLAHPSQLKNVRKP